MREYGILFWQLSRKTPESLGILNNERTGCATAAPFGRFCFQQSCVKAERKAIRNCGEGELYLTFLFLLYHGIKGNMNIAPNKIGYIYHAGMDLHLLTIEQYRKSLCTLFCVATALAVCNSTDNIIYLPMFSQINNSMPRGLSKINLLIRN